MSETNEYVGNTGSIPVTPSSEAWLSLYQLELERQLFKNFPYRISWKSNTEFSERYVFHPEVLVKQYRD